MSSKTSGDSAHGAHGIVSMVFICLVTLAIAALLPTRSYAEEPEPPLLTEADAAVLLDKECNVLYEKNGTKREHPASITKVMTAMVILDSGHDLSEVVELTAPDLGENSQMGDYATGDKVELRELLQVMLVYSGNDAAYNAAVYVAGSEEAFVELMNKKAAEIGMEHTHFSNSHGLEGDDHYSCAYDLALMGNYALEHYPFIAQTAMQPSVDAHLYGEILNLQSTDKLLETYYGIRGMKTGAIIGNYTFLGASGRGDIQLYSAVLGCATYEGRFVDTTALMDWGYANYGKRTLTNSNWAIRTQPYSYDLGLKSVVSPEGDYTASEWPYAGSFESEGVLSSPHYLLDANEQYGWNSWKQAGGELGGSIYTTREIPVRVSSWPTFTLPLFEDTATLGRL